MNKRKLHHYWTRFRVVGFIPLLVAILLCSGGAILALRQNNLRAIELRDQVLQVDKDDGDINKALNELRSYVYSHMNANLATNTSVYPPIQLKYHYERLVAAEKERVRKINVKVYPEAQKLCERLNPRDFSGKNRVPCINAYVLKHAVKENPIPDSLYKFDFASPNWSPDLAGWLIVLSGLLGFITIIKLLVEFWFRQALKD